ncbi:hypothetical protein [Pleomorphomonas oryzae]|uniref:hypothetical protein n=1 Tax=Pleomorphomonas oryzae TaxID=261934 RepID=UPI00042044F8|nr:hypothetical protein [Pleomorphomonas oryzae]
MANIIREAITSARKRTKVFGGSCAVSVNNIVIAYYSQEIGVIRAERWLNLGPMFALGDLTSENKGMIFSRRAVVRNARFIRLAGRGVVRLPR